jgi:hypothetical protein
LGSGLYESKTLSASPTIWPQAGFDECKDVGETTLLK